jgi:hypothetical protein
MLKVVESIVKVGGRVCGVWIGSMIAKDKCENSAHLDEL